MPDAPSCGSLLPPPGPPTPTPTPGVLTKLDIMDRGTDAVAVLKNEAVPLALGFVGVVLRRCASVAGERLVLCRVMPAHRLPSFS